MPGKDHPDMAQILNTMESWSTQVAHNTQPQELTNLDPSSASRRATVSLNLNLTNLPKDLLQSNLELVTAYQLALVS